MKFVKDDKGAEKQLRVAVNVQDESITVNIDSCNVFFLRIEGDFKVWNKHGVDTVAEGKINFEENE